MAAGRLISILIVAGSWIWVGVKFVLNLISYATIPEDAEVAKTRLEHVLGFIVATPWWAVIGFALLATLWLMWVSWPRNRALEPKKEKEIDAELPVETQGNIKSDNSHLMGAGIDLSIHAKNGLHSYWISKSRNIHDITIYPTRPLEFTSIHKQADGDETSKEVAATMDAIAKSLGAQSQKSKGENWENAIIIHIIFSNSIIDPFVTINISQSTDEFFYRVEQITSRYCAVAVGNFYWPCQIWIDVTPREGAKV